MKNSTERIEIVQEWKKGKSVIELSKKAGVSRSTIYNWIKQFKNLTSDDSKVITSQDYYRLRSQFQKSENMISIMKNTTLSMDATTKEKVYEIQRLLENSSYSLNELCESLQISKDTYYRHLKKVGTLGYWENRRVEYSKKIKNIFDEHNQRIGSEKITAIMKAEGYPTSQPYVKELMNEMGLISMRIGSKAYYKKQLKSKRDLINRQFSTTKPNEVWVADITEFKYKNKIYKLCVILDLYSRKVIAYKLSLTASTQLLTKCMRHALNSRTIDNQLIFHSDNGSQFVSYSFRKLLIENEISQSFSRPYNPYDNSVIESFFSNFKQEEFYRRNYSSVKELEVGIDQYMTYYNDKRPHSSINNMTPNAKETAYYDNVKKMSNHQS